MRFLFYVTLLFLLLNMTTLRIRAQAIDFDTSISGRLASGPADEYPFVAREGQLLSFLARSDDDLDVMLSIENVSGQIIMSNDDYNYPESLDAIIEGFVAPYTGSYTLVVSGYGETSGSYDLSMLPGYSVLALQTEFDSSNGWTAVTSDLIEAPTLSIVNGTANLVQTGIDQIGIGVGVSSPGETFYIRTQIDSISDNVGWRAGLIFGYQDPQNYYRVTVNYRGAWRMVASKNGTDIVLRDWNVHPAILADTRNFTLGVLVNGTSFDVFYDDQYIGSGSDRTYEGGDIGLIAETVSAIGSEVTVRFDDLLITEPVLVGGEPIFPAMIVQNGTNSSIRELQQRQLVPTSGELLFTLNESFAQNNQLGVSRFDVGGGQTATNFALGARVSWAATAADLNGCGIVVRDDGDANYVLAYIDSDGGFGLSEYSDGEFVQNAYNIRDETQLPPHDILLVVNDDVIHYYVDKIHALTMSIGVREGAIAEAVVNFDALNTNCQFNNLWVWDW